MSTLCLNMIVRNEAARIERVLASVQPYTQKFVIVDTGSTDDTVARINAFATRHNWPGKIVTAPFVDFAQARNAALAAGREHAADCDYFLLVDADMELVVTDPQVFAALTANIYQLEQVNGQTHYWNARLARVKSDAEYRGVTHEFLWASGRTESLRGAYFRDHADGANRVEKVPRDERLLKQGLASPECGMALRYMFYLAQTYATGRNYAEAARWYAARADLGGWEEERWYACYSAGNAYRELKDPRALEYLQRAIHECPMRAEPLVAAAELAAEHKWWADVVRYATQALDLPRPEHGLFIDDTAYRLRPLGLLIVACYYAKAISMGRAACNTMLVHPNATPQNDVFTMRNYAWYAPSVTQMCPAATITPVPFAPADSTYSGSSLSTCLRASGARVGMLRTVNYAISVGGPCGIRFIPRDYGTPKNPTGQIRTQNVFIQFDEQWRPVSTRYVDVKCAAAPHATQVIGFEDIRLYEVEGRLRGIAMCTQYSAGGMPAQVVLDLADNGDIINVIVPQFAGAHAEKNWLPILGRKCDLLYKLFPRQVLRVNDDGSVVDITPVTSTPDMIKLQDYRGSSQVLPHPECPGHWLTIGHHCATFSDRMRQYYHRLTHLDENFQVVQASPLFYFSKIGVEYCLGMTFDGGTAVIPFSQGEAATFILRVPVTDLLGMLVDVQKMQCSSTSSHAARCLGWVTVRSK